MDAVILELWPRLVGSEKASHTSFTLFFRDAAALLTPHRVISLEDPPDTLEGDKTPRLELLPQRNALFALSDLIRLFRAERDGRTNDTPTSARFCFYAAQIAKLPTPLLAAFSAEVGSRAKSLEREAEGDPRVPMHPSASSTDMKGGKRPLKKFIEEV
jgi:hypothetical protein